MERPPYPAVDARAVPPRATQTRYPEPFASRMSGREKRALGDHFGIQAFGVNLTRLAPGGISALHHRHSRQEEFVYVLEGEPTLVTDRDAVALRPGMCAGFRPDGGAHHLENQTAHDAVVLEVGNRPPDDQGTYPLDDLRAVLGDDGRWRFAHADGTPY